MTTTRSNLEPMLLRPSAVARRLGVSRSTLWRLSRNDPDFPKSIGLTRGAVAWRVSELDAWVDRRAGESSPK